MVPASPHVGLEVVVMDLLKHRVDVLHLEVHTRALLSCVSGLNLGAALVKN